MTFYEFMDCADVFVEDHPYMLKVWVAGVIIISAVSVWAGIKIYGCLFRIWRLPHVHIWGGVLLGGKRCRLCGLAHERYRNVTGKKK